MLAAMTMSKMDLRSTREPPASTSVSNGDDNGSSVGDEVFKFHSGLSALIEAATSELSDVLAEEGRQKTDAAISHTEPSKGATHNFVVATEDIGDTINSWEGGIEERIRQKSLLQQSTDASIDPVQTELGVHAEPDPRKQSFPEVLMTLAVDPSYADVITFLPDGKFFAIRSKDFEAMLLRYFNVSTLSEFMDLSNDWGFTRIRLKGGEKDCFNGIEVFRHPQFVKGDWQKCSRIEFGASAFPRIEYGMTSSAPSSPTSYPFPEPSSMPPSSSKPPLHRNENPNHERSDDNDHASNLNKRRLSPGFLARRESESPSASSQKSKIHLMPSESNDAQPDSQLQLHDKLLVPSGTDVESVNLNALQRRKRRESSESDISENHRRLQLNTSSSSSASPPPVHQTSSSSPGSTSPQKADDELRSLALSITAEKLNLGGSSDCNQARTDLNPNFSTGLKGSSRASTPGAASLLVEQAVESATHTIVTDAIETLLRDESHSIRTYLKHEKELSKSSLPGVIPISTQLFAGSSSKNMVKATPPSSQECEEDAAERLSPHKNIETDGSHTKLGKRDVESSDDELIATAPAATRMTPSKEGEDDKERGTEIKQQPQRQPTVES